MALHLRNLCLEVFQCVDCCQRGPGSLLQCHPLLAVNCVFFPQSLYEWTITDKMFWATAMIAALLLCLGILYSPCQAHHKFFSSPFDSTWMVALFVLVFSGLLFFQMCQTHCWCSRGGLVALEFPQGEETGSSQFWSIVGCLGSHSPGQLHGVFFLHFPGSP